MVRIKLVVSLAAVLLAGLFLSLRLGTSQLTAAQNAGTHKVIAPAGVLTEGTGVTLWHDYGAFGLYRVTDAALSGLSGDELSRVTLADEMDRILIDSYSFDTQRETLNLPAGWEASAVSGSALQLIQFVGPIKAEWLDAVEAAGVIPIHYIANNAYLAWADGDGRNQLQTLAQNGDFLQYSALYQPAFKLNTALANRLAAGVDQSETIPVVIQMIRHPGQSQTETMIEKRLVAAQSGWQPIRQLQNIIGTIRLGDIAAIAARPDVLWVGQQFERERFDEVQGQILAASLDGSMTGPGGPGYLAWLDSLGFSSDPADYPIIDITDDGIGNGAINSGDPTLHELGSATNPTRLAYVSNCTSAADGGSPDGHGHINASIAGGYDMRAGAPYQDGDGFQRGLGINPYGRLAGTRIFTDVFDLSGCGGTETGLIQHTQDSGAQISSNSWGCGSCASDYDASSQAYDVGVRDSDLTEPGNQELIFIFAAGNSGPNPGTVGTPGNGKNVITVGASENDRPTWIDGCLIAPDGADNIMDVIYFSSRGPAPGDRAKPELIAPGTHIQGTASTHSNYAGSGVCDPFQPTGQTIFAASSGTSHSTPAVAGVAALSYYWLESRHNMPSPSPALMKAYLIAHPTYLTGVGANDNLPSNSQGYGMPDMSQAFDNTPRTLLDQSVVLGNSGETWTLTGAVADPVKPLRVVLAYTDQEGLIGTSPQVNDLNLTVELNGQTYLGNNFSGQWSVAGGTADTANNYEAVFLPIGVTGNFTITVTAFNIAGDGLPNSGDSTDQDFALVCYNCAGQPDFTLQAAPVTQAICAPDEAIYDITIGQMLGYVDPVTLSATGPFSTAFSLNPVAPPGSSQLTIGDTGVVAAGDYEIPIMGMAPTSTHTATVRLTVYDDLPGDITLSTPGDGATGADLAPTFAWSDAAQAASYLLEIAEDADFTTIVHTATVKGVSYVMPQDLAALTTYYWRVQAANSCGLGSQAGPFSFTTNLIACSAPGVAIPDGDIVGVSSVITVTEPVTMTDLNVLLNVSHPWVGDLSVVLAHEDTGVQVTLIDRPGVPATSWGCGLNDIDAILDDEATSPVEEACDATGVAISGSVTPEETLSAFDGELWPGVWRLTVADHAAWDSGVLNQWCLLPTYGTELNRTLFFPILMR